MFKKIIQAAFIFIAMTAFAQEKDRLGVPGPLTFETSESTVEFILTKSSVNAKTRTITQEYLPKSKTGDRIVVTFQPSTEAPEIWEKKAEEIKSNKDGKIYDVAINSLDDQLYSIRYNVKGEKAAERREILIGNVKADTDASKGSYIVEYFGGTSKEYLNLEKLPEMLSVKPAF